MGAGNVGRTLGTAWRALETGPTAGDLTLARMLEPYALLWIRLALRRGFGTHFAFGLLRGQS